MRSSPTIIKKGSQVPLLIVLPKISEDFSLISDKKQYKKNAPIQESDEKDEKLKETSFNLYSEESYKVYSNKSPILRTVDQIVYSKNWLQKIPFSDPFQLKNLEKMPQIRSKSDLFSHNKHYLIIKNAEKKFFFDEKNKERVLTPTIINTKTKFLAKSSERMKKLNELLAICDKCSMHKKSHMVSLKVENLQNDSKVPNSRKNKKIKPKTSRKELRII